MGMKNPMPQGPSEFLAVSSSSDISEGWTVGVCPVHIPSMGLSFYLTVGWVSSTSLTIAVSWTRGYYSSQVWTATAVQN